MLGLTYQREEGEEETDELVEELNVQQNLAANSVVCFPDLLPVQK
jgi:hypothetical protein